MNGQGAVYGRGAVDGRGAVTDGFRVDGAGLGDHAARADGRAARLQLAADAGRPLDPGTYGLVGQVFTAAAAGAECEGSAAVARVAGSAAGIGDALRAVHAGYLDADARAETTFTGLR